MAIQIFKDAELNGKNGSPDPMKWQAAADALRAVGLHSLAKSCHETAGRFAREANQAEMDAEATQ